MLDKSVTGIKTPSERDLRILSKKDIAPMSKIIITRRYLGEEYPVEVTNITDYEISEDRQFGASSLTLSGTNEDGRYSYANEGSQQNILFANDINDSDVAFIITEDSSNVQLDVDGYVVMTEPSETGVWVSNPFYGGVDFHSWRKITWDIDPGKYIRNGTYYGSVSVYVRFGDSFNVNDGTWTTWQKVSTITGEGSIALNQQVVISTQQFAQVKCELFGAYGKVSPTIKSIVMKRFKNVGKKIKSPLFYYGNKIEVQEFIVSEDGSYIEPFTVFKGFIDSVNPHQTATSIGLQVQALDYMKICLNDFIEKPDPRIEGDGIFESVKIRETSMQLEEVTGDMDDDGDGIPDVTIVLPEEEASVFRVPIEYRNNGPIRGYEGSSGPKGDTRGDFKYQPWAERPTPLIYVENDDGEYVLQQGGYQIDYARGTVYFTEQQKKPDGTTRGVKATFYWYDLDTNLFEDVVGEIIARAIERFGYKKPILETRNYEDGYDVWTSDAPNSPKIILEHSNPRTTLPPLSYRLDDEKTFFDALVDCRRYVTPDYILRATPQGNFVGEYLPQKATADYQLTLIGEMDAPVSEEDIFTRCVARGINPSVLNVASEAEFSYTLSPSYGNSSTSTLKDGDYSNYVGWYWKGTSPISSFPLEAVRIKLKTPIRLGGLNILVAQGPPPYSGCVPVACVSKINISNVGFRVEVSNDGNLWFDLTGNNTEFVGSTGEWIRIDKGDFHDDILEMNVRHIRILITQVDSFNFGHPWGLGELTTMWAWSLGEVQIYPDEVIRREVSVQDLVTDELVQMPKELADDMEERIGTKTIVLPIDASLRTPEMVRARALDYLFETARNLYTSQVEVVYAPHVQVGHTVSVYNPKLIATQSGQAVGKRLYYVDGVSRRMEGTKPSVTVSLVSWA